MPSIGPTEVLLIVVVLVLLFGGRKLPELARGAGQSIRIFRKEIDDRNEDTAA